jgi:Ca2+-dependent lipid-binding protein
LLLTSFSRFLLFPPGKSDPYVTFEVEKDGFFSDKTMGTAQSTKKKDEVNPVYNESFNFTLPELKDMELKIKVREFTNVQSPAHLGPWFCPRMPSFPHVVLLSAPSTGHGRRHWI